jgi:hypothetical protein
MNALFYRLTRIPSAAPKAMWRMMVIGATSGEMSIPAIPAPRAGKSPKKIGPTATITAYTIP